MLLSACGLSILDDGYFCGCGRSDPTVSDCAGEGKDDESESDLMTSSQTKGNRVSDVKL